MANSELLARGKKKKKKTSSNFQYVVRKFLIAVTLLLLCRSPTLRLLLNGAARNLLPAWTYKIRQIVASGLIFPDSLFPKRVEYEPVKKTSQNNGSSLAGTKTLFVIT